jgi:hypothetical protein
MMGYTNKRGPPYSASCVKPIVEGPTPSAIACRDVARAILRHRSSQAEPYASKIPLRIN